MSAKAFHNLDVFLKKEIENGVKIFVLMDKNTRQHCLPYVLKQCPELKKATDYFITAPGEAYKNLETVVSIWNALSAENATRNSIFINLGGGVICDMGAFAASTFKRGMRFIQIPTTLLAMADAAIGGKTAIDFNNLKNQIGTFAEAEKVIIDEHFLQTLPENELRSGFAEIIKMAIVKGPKEFDLLRNQTYKEISDWQPWIEMAVSEKEKIVQKDLTEKNIRKRLNLGHTFGHAFESLALERELPLTHGEAVAMGLVCDAYLSVKYEHITSRRQKRIEDYILQQFPYFKISAADTMTMLFRMRQDKKNKADAVRSTLITPKEILFDVEIPDTDIVDTLAYYRALAVS